MKTISICTVLLAFAAGGCSMDPKRVENDFGSSVRQMVAAQIHDPEAASNPALEGPDLIDGVAAGNGVDGYREASKRESGDSGAGIVFTVR